MADRCDHRCCGGDKRDGHAHLFGVGECLSCRDAPLDDTPRYDVPLMVIVNGVGYTYTDACAHAITQVKLAGFDVLEQQVPVLNPQPVEKDGDG